MGSYLEEGMSVEDRFVVEGRFAEEGRTVEEDKFVEEVPNTRSPGALLGHWFALVLLFSLSVWRPRLSQLVLPS